jgi:hypothetical protein
MTNTTNDAQTRFPVPAAAPEPAAFTAEEAGRLQSRLMPLLERQMRLKTQGDSASMPEEEAAELMESVVFTLRFGLDTRGLSERALLTEDLAPLFRESQKTVTDFAAETEALYKKALAEVRTWGSRALRDTLAGIGGSLRAYDARIYAHRVPGMIDYPLCLPLPESLQGITYLHEYLRRLTIENELLCRFAPARVAALLSRACPEYRELIVNLYEPVAADVAGLSMLGGGGDAPGGDGRAGGRIAKQLSPLPPSAARALLQAAARNACGRLALSRPGACA